MDSAISTKNLSYAYGKQIILSDVNVSFPKHKFSVLLGSNGSGKSTLFNIVAGILKGHKGDVYINDENINTIKSKSKAHKIGFLPQFYHTVFPYTVEEILLTGRAAFSGFNPTKDDKAWVQKVLEDLEIAHLRNKIFSDLSGGEQQIVMVGRVLMQDPGIIVLDEPTNHLDVYYQQFLMEKLKGYSLNGYTVIAVMHNPTLAYQYAEKVFFMLNKTVLCGYSSMLEDIDLLHKTFNTNFINFQHNNLKIVLPVRKA